MVNDIKIMIAKALANKLNRGIFTHNILIEEYTMVVEPTDKLCVCFEYMNEVYSFVYDLNTLLSSIEEIQQ